MTEVIASYGEFTINIAYETAEMPSVGMYFNHRHILPPRCEVTAGDGRTYRFTPEEATEVWSAPHDRRWVVLWQVVARRQRKTVQAKHLPDSDVLAVVRDLQPSRLFGVMMGDLQEAFPLFPRKVLVDKVRRLIRRGLVEGCACGCGGYLEIVEGLDG